MKRIHLFILFILIFSFFMGICVYSQSGNKKWTVMVYMNGPQVINDEVYNFLNDLELAGGNENCNVLLFTNTQLNNHGENGIFLVNQDLDEKHLNVEYLDGNGYDIGDPTTLSYFLNYCKNNFPADNYVFILKRFYADFSSENGDFFSDIVSNPKTGRKLGISGENNIASLLSDFSQSTGKKFNLIFMDVPYELNLENILAFKDVTSYYAGCERGNLDGNFWYSTFLDPLGSGEDGDFDMSLKKLFISAKKEGLPHLALIDTGFSDQFIDAFNKFVFSLISLEFDNKTGDIAREWRGNTNPIGYEEGLSLVDFRSFLNGISVKAYTLNDSVGKLNNILDEMVIGNYSKAKGGFEGFSIYFPPEIDQYISDYDNLSISKFTYWDSYLKGQRVVNEGDPFDMTSHDGIDFLPGDAFEIDLNGVVVSVNPDEDYFQVDGTLELPSVGTVSISNLRLKLSSFVMDNQIVILNYPTLTVNSSNFSFDGIEVFNPQIVWDSSGIHIDGDLRISDVPLAGSELTLHANANFTFQNGHLTFENFEADNINGFLGGLTLTGSGTFETNPYKLTFNGKAILDGYGELNFENLTVGFDGHIFSYGTVSYSGNGFNIGSANINNMLVQWDGDGIYLQGSLKIQDVTLMGAPLTFSSDITAMLSFMGSDLELSALDISSIHGEAGNVVVDGNASFYKNPDRIRIDGTLVAGNYGNFQVSDLEVGLDGSIVNLGSVLYNNDNIVIDNITLTNVSVELKQDNLSISGNFSISNIPFGGTTLNISGGAIAEIGFSGNAATLNDFLLDNVTVTGGSVQINGNVYLLHNPDRLQLEGEIETDLGVFHFSDFEVGFNGQVYSYGTVVFNGNSFTYQNLTINNPTVVLTDSNLILDGNFDISGVLLMGETFDFSGSVRMVIGLNGGGATVESFEITKISGASQSTTINGNVTYSSNPPSITIDGTVTNSIYGTLNVSGLVIGLDGHVIDYGTITYTANTFTIDGVTFTNAQITWDGNSLQVSGTVEIDNIPIGGHNFNLITNGSAVISGGHLQSLDISDFNMSDGDFTFSGGCSYNGNTHEITLNGNAVLGQYGTLTVENMILGLDGHVHSYGTVTYSGSSININGATINNVNVVLDDFHIGISGDITIPDVMIAGSPVTINTTASASFTIDGGLQLSQFDVNNFSVVGGGFTLNGEAHLIHNPDRLSISGTFDTTQYGTFTLNGFEVGFDGTVYSYGTLIYQNPQIVIDNVTINNLLISLSADAINISGNININNVSLSGQALDFTANVSVGLVNNGSGFVVQNFSITKVMATYGDFSIVGSGVLLHSPDRIRIDGSAHLSQYGDVTFNDLEIGLDGTVYNYGTLTYNLSTLTVGNVTFKDVSISWSSTNLYVSGNILIPNVQLAGGTMDLAFGGNASFILGSGGFQLVSLNLSNVHVAYNDFILDGSAQYLQNPDRVKIDGSATIGGYGNVSVSDLEVGFDGHVYSYGTITYTNSYMQIGNATLTNVIVSWNGSALMVGGTISVNGIQLSGGVLGFSASAQAIFTTAGGVHLTQMNITGISASYNDFSISGNATYLSSPDRIVINGQAILGQYGNVTINGLTVGLDGTVYSYGTITYQSGYIQIGDLYLNNVMASWDGAHTILSGTIGLNSDEVSLSATGVITLVNTPSGVQLADFQLTGMSGQIEGFSFNGDAQYDASIPGFHLTGGILVDGIGSVSVSDMVVDMNGHILSVGGTSGSVTIGAYSFSGNVSFPGPGEIYVEGYVSLPQFISGEAGGFIHLRKHPGGGVLNSGWDVLEGGMSLPSFEIGNYTFSGGNFGFDQEHIYGSGTLQVPSMVGIKFSFDFGWDGTFNSACLAATGMRIPLSSTGLFLNEAGGCLYHYHNPQDYWEVELDGVVSDATGMFKLDSMLSVSTIGELRGVGVVEVGDFPFSSAQIDISIPNDEIDASAWLGEDPDEGLHVTGISVTGNLDLTMNWHDDWVYSKGGLHLHIVSIINAGADGGFVYNYPYMPFSFGDAECEKLYHNGLGAAGEVHFLWVEKVYGVRVEDNNGLDFDVFHCDAD